MNKLSVIFLVPLFFNAAFAQKKVLDTTNYKEWKSLSIPSISADGNWISYTVSDQPDTKFLVNTRNDKKITLNGIQGLDYFSNGAWIKYAVAGPKNTTILMRLKDGKKIFWNRPEYFQTNPESSIISYTTTVKTGRNLTFKDVESGDSIMLGQVDKSNLYHAGSSIIYLKDRKLLYGAILGKHLQVADGVSDFSFDEKKKSGTYYAQDKLYAFSLSKKGVELVLDFSTIKAPEGFKVVGKAYNLQKGVQDVELEVSPLSPVRYVRMDPAKPKATGFDLELWTWNEEKSQRLQRKGSYQRSVPEEEKFIYHVADKSWFRVRVKNQSFVLVPTADHYKLVLQTDPEPYKKMVDWRYDNNVDIYSINTYTKERKLVAKDSYSAPQWSPNGKFAILYNAQEKKWTSLDETTNEFRPISDQIGFPIYNEFNDVPTPPHAYGIAGWADGGNSVLIYDRYDIWTVDLTGKKPAQSLTAGYGRRNGVVLRLQGAEYKENLDLTKPQLFTGFRESTKNKGLYQLNPGKTPVVLSDKADYNIKVIGRSNDGSFVFTKESYTMFPDIWFANSSFAMQKCLTNLNPQQQSLNWGTAKLVKWKTFEGKDNEGLLYVPENYDPKKSYPMIVDFYETHSQDLHDYITPLYSTATINIPTYVSKGYLVFRPDVHFKIGTPGESAYNCVVSGTQDLIKKGIADPKLIGLQGHSWSGFEVAYILTKTPIFTCANVGAGVVNSTYNYFAIRANGAPCMFKYEVEQSRLGANLWENTDVYLQNSPIFNADKIKTPLVILHNDKDGAVAFTQGLDLFLAMRRLEKPAWLLNYRGQNHTLESLPAQQDWTLRMEQFFDHYLKDKPIPRWMSEGINVDERNVDLKYNY